MIIKIQHFLKPILIVPSLIIFLLIYSIFIKFFHSCLLRFMYVFSKTSKKFYASRNLLVYNSIGISGKDDNFTNDWQFLQNSLTLGGKFDFMTIL